MDKPNRQAYDEIELTPEMIKAGFRELCASGLVDDYQGEEKRLVVDIFRAMYAQLQVSQKGSQ